MFLFEILFVFLQKKNAILFHYLLHICFEVSIESSRHQKITNLRSFSLLLCFIIKVPALEQQKEHI